MVDLIVDKWVIANWCPNWQAQGWKGSLVVFFSVVIPMSMLLITNLIFLYFCFFLWNQCTVCIAISKKRSFVRWAFFATHLPAWPFVLFPSICYWGYTIFFLRAQIYDNNSSHSQLDIYEKSEYSAVYGWSKNMSTKKLGICNMIYKWYKRKKFEDIILFKSILSKSEMM